MNLEGGEYISLLDQGLNGQTCLENKVGVIMEGYVQKKGEDFEEYLIQLQGLG